MKQMTQPKRHSGFTLIEMVIVIAIIGILTGILIPTMTGYVTRSRLNTANANAKVLFNSMQTIVQEYEFSERHATDSLFYSDGSGTMYLVGEKGTITTFTTSDKGSIVGEDRVGAVVTPTTSPASFGARLSRLCDHYNEICWKAYIENYTVRFVCCATEMTVDYVGGYPRQATEKNQYGGLKLGGIQESDIAALAAAAWTV